MASSPSAAASRSQLITSFAILKVNHDRQGLDYIDYFVPFVAETLRSWTHGATPADLQAAILRDFGLTLPQAPVRTIARRSVRHGWATTFNGSFFPVTAKLDETRFSDLRNEALQQQDVLLKRFADYVRPFLDRSLSDEEASTALLNYVDRRGVAFLRFRHDAASQPPISEANADNIDFLVNGFVIELSRKRDDGLIALETFVKGSMLAAAIHAVTLGRERSRYDKLHVYLDTRILLRLLGLAGDRHEVVARELFDLAYGLGATIRCFEHTLVEVRGVLLSAANALRYRNSFRQGAGETLEYLASSGYGANDVEQIAADLPARLEAARVSIYRSPPHRTEWTIDESAFETMLRKQVNYRSQESLRHDVDCISAIHRLRHDHLAQEPVCCARLAHEVACRR